MTTYRLYPSTSGPANSTNDTAQYVMGLSFKVTSPGLVLQGWWFWVASDQQTGAEDFALWTVSGAASGVYVANSKVTSAAFTAGQWNFVSAATPIPLTSGQEYRAVKSTNFSGTQTNSYSHTNDYFDTGAGNAGVVNGPLLAYSAPGQATNPEPSGDGQMVFVSASTNVTTAYPSSEFEQTNYWLDVQAATSASPSAGPLPQVVPPAQVAVIGGIAGRMGAQHSR